VANNAPPPALLISVFLPSFQFGRLRFPFLLRVQE